MRFYHLELRKAPRFGPTSPGVFLQQLPLNAAFSLTSLFLSLARNTPVSCKLYLLWVQLEKSRAGFLWQGEEWSGLWSLGRSECLCITYGLLQRCPLWYLSK